MIPFNIALLQLKTSDTIENNLKIGIEACKEAKSKGADLALFPELWNIGYQFDKVSPEFSIGIESNFVRAYQELAHELEMAIGLTLLLKGEKKPKDSLLLIDTKGDIILNYAKVHTCTFSKLEEGFEPGKEFMVANLKFKYGNVILGSMICYDREFPESARILAIKGAEIIITPNACLLRDDPMVGDVKIAQFRTRAFENMVGVAMANYPDPFMGYSCAFDVDGKAIFEPQSEAGIYIAQFDLDKIRNWQKTEIWGMKYGRPECYRGT